MTEIFHLALSHVNIVPSIFFCLTIAYWISLILGALDLGFLDFDFDAEYESDVNMDVDFDANAEIQGNEIGNGTRLLWFFNVGKVPFMVLFTFWATPSWFICILGNYYLNGIESWIIGSLILAGSFFISLFIAKIFTQPLVKLFQKMEKMETKNEDLIGRYCYAKFDINNNKIGQVVISHDGSEYVVNAKTMNSKTVSRNGQALVIDYDKEENVYFIEPHESV